MCTAAGDDDEVCCMISYLPIPPDMMVQIDTHHFDLRSLVKEYLSSGRLDNPFTRLPLPGNVQQRVAEYGTLIIPCDNSIVSLNCLETIGDTVLRCLRVAGSIHDVCQYDVLLDGVSLYTFDLQSTVEELPRNLASRVDHQRGVEPNHLSAMHKYLSRSGGDYDSLLNAIERELRDGACV